MDAERLRTFLLKMPHVVATTQWGNNLVFWVGDKAIGGKMFALVNLDGDGKGVISYAAGPEHYAELLELDGLIPAPYFARIFWIAAERWNVFRHASEWEKELRAACERTLANLPPKVRAALVLPAKERQRLITERLETTRARAAAAPVPPKRALSRTSQGSRQTARETKAGTHKAGRVLTPYTPDR